MTTTTEGTSRTTHLLALITGEQPRDREQELKGVLAGVGKPVKVAYLRGESDGTISALSSNGRDVYVIRNTADGAWLCSCPAGVNGRLYEKS